MPSDGCRFVDRLWIPYNPEQDKVAAEDEWMRTWQKDNSVNIKNHFMIQIQHNVIGKPSDNSYHCLCV